MIEYNVMFRLIPALALILLLFSDPVFALSEFSGKVVKVSDGDTVTALPPTNQQVRMRLYGIDCPERKQAFGQSARQYTASRVAGQTVRIQILDTDRYGQAGGVVHADDGGNLNRELIDIGLAWVYPQYCKASFCSEWNEREMRTRRAGTGLWIEKSPIEPWVFRKIRRGI